VRAVLARRERAEVVALVVRSLPRRAGALRVLLAQGRARLGVAGLSGVVLVAVLADVLASDAPLSLWPDPDAAFAPLAPPTGAHWLGTDALGRDVLARLVHGARAALLLGVSSASIVTLLGVGLGALGGFYGGRVDALLTRSTEVLLSLPTLLAVLALRGITGDTRLLDVAVVFGLLRWTDISRMIRAEVLRARASDFVLAAFALGVAPLRVLSRHILPQALAPAIVAAPIAMGAAMVVDASLAMLGGSGAVEVPTWGGLLSDARAHREAWWLAVFPGIALFVSVASLNLIGESLRDALDPRLRVLRRGHRPVGSGRVAEAGASGVPDDGASRSARSSTRQ
jgi:peptide/nickel transport system permease protein